MFEVNPSFWSGKRIFLTGHTGFKGGWLTLWLAKMGAEVVGYSLPPNTTPNLYNLARIENLLYRSYFADIRDLDCLRDAIRESRPEIVIHMAAQPLVRYSYENPVETFSTNVMGTVNLLESLRSIESVLATLIVTTDKCYDNKEWVWGYRENDPLGGRDPYSASKGCAEMVTSAYRESFFNSIKKNRNAIASARAGNVIGGGDWSDDRLIPDALKAFDAKRTLVIRNPNAIRPWQHVLEPLSGYLILLQQLYEKGFEFASGWNFGPNNQSYCSVSDVVSMLIKKLNIEALVEINQSDQVHEANFLKLDCSKANQQLNWYPRWNIETSLEKIANWQKALQGGKDMYEYSLLQITEYLAYKNHEN